MIIMRRIIIKTIRYSENLIIFGLENWLDISQGHSPTCGLDKLGTLKRIGGNPMEASLTILADINRAISQLAIDEGVNDKWHLICQLQPIGIRMRCKELTPAQQRIVRIYILNEMYRGYWKDDCWGIIGRMKRYLNGEPERTNNYRFNERIQAGREIITQAIKEKK